MIDRPSPGIGYMVLQSGFITLMGGLFALLVVSLTGESRLTQIATVVLFFIPLGGLMLIPVHAALKTRYGLTDDRLDLRSGFVIKASLPWTEIHGVEQVGFIPRVLGWGGGRGLANRLTDGLRITLHSGAVYYISPSDPGAFATAIDQRVEAAADEAPPN